jgi:hypothetical protein
MVGRRILCDRREEVWWLLIAAPDKVSVQLGRVLGLKLSCYHIFSLESSGDPSLNNDV